MSDLLRLKSGYVCHQFVGFVRNLSFTGFYLLPHPKENEPLHHRKARPTRNKRPETRARLETLEKAWQVSLASVGVRVVPEHFCFEFSLVFTLSTSNTHTTLQPDTPSLAISIYQLMSWDG